MSADCGPMPPTANSRKYQNTNPIVRWAIARFFRRLGDAIAPLSPASVLDAGCGEGETIVRLRSILPRSVTGFDRNPAAVECARRRLPGLDISVQDIYRLPWADSSFDLVLCTEVLEHLAEPDRALAELVRVARRDLVVSVPHEPWFETVNRAGNIIAPGSYDPSEHVQHYTPAALRRLLAPCGRQVTVRFAAVWTIAHVPLDDAR